MWDYINFSKAKVYHNWSLHMYVILSRRKFHKLSLLEWKQFQCVKSIIKMKRNPSMCTWLQRAKNWMERINIAGERNGLTSTIPKKKIVAKTLFIERPRYYQEIRWGYQSHIEDIYSGIQFEIDRTSWLYVF